MPVNHINKIYMLISILVLILLSSCSTQPDYTFSDDNPFQPEKMDFTDYDDWIVYDNSDDLDVIYRWRTEQWLMDIEILDYIIVPTDASTDEITIRYKLSNLCQYYIRRCTINETINFTNSETYSSRITYSLLPDPGTSKIIERKIERAHTDNSIISIDAVFELLNNDYYLILDMKILNQERMNIQNLEYDITYASGQSYDALSFSGGAGGNGISDIIQYTPLEENITSFTITNLELYQW